MNSYIKPRFVLLFLITVILAVNLNFGHSHAYADQFTIKYEVERDYPPFKYLHNEHLDGFDVDLGNMIFKGSLYNIIFSMDNWENVYKKLKKGTIDTCGLMAISEERRKDVLFSKPVLKSYLAIYQRKSSKSINLNNLKNHIVGVEKDQNSEYILRNKVGLKEYLTYKTINDGLEALKRGDIDALFENQEVANYYIIQKELKGIIVPNVRNLYPVEYAFGISKKKPELLKFINARLSELQSTGDFEELYQKYFLSHSINYNKELRFKFTVIALLSLFGLFLLVMIIQLYIKHLRKKILNINHELSKEHESLRVIMSSIRDAVIATDKNGMITFINDMASTLTGFFPEEIAGKKVNDILKIVNEETGKISEIPIYEVITEGRIISFSENLRLIKRDGSELLITDSITPIKNNQNEVLGAVIVLQDITQKINAQEDLRWEREFSSNIVKNADIIIMLWKTDGTILSLNRFGEDILDCKEEDIKGKKWNEVFIPWNSKEENYYHLINLEDQNSNSHEREYRKKDGAYLNILWNNSFIYDSFNKCNIVVSIGMDVTIRKEAEKKLADSYDELEATHEQLAAAELELNLKYNELKISQELLLENEERFKLAIDGSNDVIWDHDLKTDKLFISPRGKEMLGYKENEILTGESFIDLIHPKDLEKFTQSMNYYFSGKNQHYRIEYRLRTKNEGYKWILSRGKAIWDDEGKPVRMAGSHTDISDRKKSEEEIHNLAYFDTLTGLPNRTLFQDRLNSALSQSRRSKQKIAVLYVDLDNFKTINDTQGHAYGDELIRKVASKMRDCIRECDTVSRLGGDEFVILQPQIKNISDVKVFAERLLGIFNDPWRIRGRDFFVTASVGITIYPNDGKDADTLLKNADSAMYKAKGTGKNNYMFFIKSMNDEIIERLDTESNLRHALLNKEFVIHYQPQINITTGKIVGVEALIRWIHPEKGLIPPMNFIPVAEETGLILQIGEWVLRTSCKQMKEWQDKGISDIQVAVNLSARQFQQHNLVDMVKNILKDTGLESKYLELEITESIAMKDLDNAILIMEKFKEMGIQVTMDDFGTGYSSLNYLKRLPINNLKIDKSFVHDIEANSNEEAIAKAVIVLSHNLKLNIIAEGVETQMQLDFLRKEKCDIVQGYMFSKPLTAEEAGKLLVKNKKFC